MSQRRKPSREYNLKNSHLRAAKSLKQHQSLVIYKLNVDTIRVNVGFFASQLFKTLFLCQQGSHHILWLLLLHWGKSKGHWLSISLLHYLKWQSPYPSQLRLLFCNQRSFWKTGKSCLKGHNPLPLPLSSIISYVNPCRLTLDQTWFCCINAVRCY